MSHVSCRSLVVVPEMKPSSASNRVFTCPELLEQILRYFSAPTLVLDDATSERYEDRRTLASCARVCRSFSDAALDVLWGTLDDVLPLLSIFSCLTEVNDLKVSIFLRSIDQTILTGHVYRRSSLVTSARNGLAFSGMPSVSAS